MIHIKSAEKNGAELTIPVHEELIAAIKACQPTGLHILETTRGKPWVKESYGKEFHDWTVEAGVVEAGEAKNSHGIRKLCATRVAEAGATDLEMMAFFGWNDPKMARVYTMAASKKKLAAQAAAKVGAVAVVQPLFADGSAIASGSANAE